LNITGRWYNREADNIGLGYAYLKGKNGIDGSQVGEIYWRVVLNDYVAVTADLQYMKDEYDAEETADIDGWIAGVRMTVEF
jgi:porin